MANNLYFMSGMIMPKDHDWQNKAMEGFRRDVVMMTPAEIAGLAVAYQQLLLQTVEKNTRYHL